MRYDRVITGTFVNRPNRFVAVCMLGSDEIAVHVKNTGRCRELLVPGAGVVLSESDNPERKYRYDLVAVYKGDLLVNMDSQAPNTVFMEWLESEHPFGYGTVVHQEYTHGDSRFDFMVESPDGPHRGEGRDVGERWVLQIPRRSDRARCEASARSPEGS